MKTFLHEGICPIRDILSRLGDKWSLLVLTTLYSNGTMRFNDIQRSLGDISQRMLELGGVTTPYRNDSLSVVNVLFTEKPRVYLNDHNEARSLNEIGMGEEDFEMLQQKGILYR